MKKEKWKFIDYKDVLPNTYEVSNYGRIRRGEKYFRGNNTKNERGGYVRISLKSLSGKSKKYQVHRIVYTMFGKDKLKDKDEINHKDGIKINNYIWNLELCDRKFNAEHAAKNDLYENCENHYKSIYTNKEVHKICKLAEQGKSISEIIDIMGFTNKKSAMSNITKILSGNTWVKISSQYNIDYNKYHYKTYNYDDLEKIAKYIFIDKMRNKDIVKLFPQYNSSNLKGMIKSFKAGRIYKKISKKYLEFND